MRLGVPSPRAPRDVSIYDLPMCTLYKGNAASKSQSSGQPSHLYENFGQVKSEGEEQVD